MSFLVGLLFISTFYCQENAMVAAKKRNQIEDGFSNFPKTSPIAKYMQKYLETRQECKDSPINAF